MTSTVATPPSRHPGWPACLPISGPRMRTGRGMAPARSSPPGSCTTTLATDPAGPGFIAGGWPDTAAPGPALAAAADDAATRRTQLGESELIGLLCGWQRLTAWTQAGQAACLTTLVQRRKQQSVELARPDLAAHVDDETAAALALPGRAARRML